MAAGFCARVESSVKGGGGGDGGGEEEGKGGAHALQGIMFWRHRLGGSASWCCSLSGVWVGG